MASHVPPSTSNPLAQVGQSQFSEEEESTGLGELLRAVQFRDTINIARAFLAWTELLGPTEPRPAAVQQAEQLPPSTFSEILRSLDPVLAPEHDVGHGLNLTWGHTTFTDVGKLVDEFGVRIHHRKILDAVRKLVAVRAQSEYGMLPADYEMAMRVAGAAADPQAAKDFWTEMGAHRPPDPRTRHSWNEFIKSRFMTEPMYYQFDRSRVAVLARTMHSNQRPASASQLEAMDKIRFSINAQKHEPWNRRRDEVHEDATRMLRRREDYRAFRAHWARGIAYGRGLNEETTCASMVAFARSSSLWHIVTEIFERTYGIRIEDPSIPKPRTDDTIPQSGTDSTGSRFQRQPNSDGATQQSEDPFAAAIASGRRIDQDGPKVKPRRRRRAESDIPPAEEPPPARTEITGGYHFSPDSPLKPTARLLNAIVEAFGTMSHISMGMKLLDFVSQRYGLAIPHETWSNLLNWTYLCASRPFHTMRKIRGDYANSRVTPADVNAVWNLMTSKPYNITPSFEDYNIYIKTLIVQRRFVAAIDAIRTHAVPHYAALVEEHRTALADEMLQADTSTRAFSRATLRRRQAETKKDFAHHTITFWLTDILSVASSARLQRSGPFAHVVIPNLIADFEDFLPQRLTYRTAHGEVALTRPGVVRRFVWAREWRHTLPQKVGGAHAPRHPEVRPGEAARLSDREYPDVDVMKVLQWKRKPVYRMAYVPRLTEQGEEEANGKARERLEREMLI